MEYSINKCVRQSYRMIFYFKIYFILFFIFMKFIKEKISYSGRGRNPKPRIISSTPLLNIRKIEGWSDSKDVINLDYDEVEALRLRFVDGLQLLEAASLMGISKSLIGNIVQKALRKLVEGLVVGKNIEIQYANKN